MIRHLLIAVTLFALGLHAAVGCCCHHAHAVVHSTPHSGEKAPDAVTVDAVTAGGFACDSCPHEESGKPCNEGRCVWLSDSEPAFDFDPSTAISATLPASSNLLVMHGPQQRIQSTTVALCPDCSRLHGMLSIWLV